MDGARHSRRRSDQSLINTKREGHLRTTWFDPREGETWEVQLLYEWAYPVIAFRGEAGTFTVKCGADVASISSLAADQLTQFLDAARAVPPAPDDA